MSRIIVGTDGSQNSIAALTWAAGHAEKTRAELVILFAWSFFDQGYHAPTEHELPEFTQADADRVVDRIVAEAQITSAYTRSTPAEFAPQALADAATVDDLIVVGARGMGGFKGLLLGSVSSRILELAPCPVVIIRDVGRAHGDGPIVVGVDGSEDSIAALHWAAGQASAAVQPLTVVLAWQPPLFGDPVSPLFIEAVEKQARDRLTGLLGDPVLAGLEVRDDLVCASPAKALLDHDKGAAMIVVARRGLGKIERFFLGSTSRQVALHATAPVVVVPHRGV